MTAKTRAQLLADLDLYLADNNSGGISPADVRQRLIDLADSAAIPVIGSFVPAFSAAGCTFNHLVQDGRYARLGDLVWFNLIVELGTTGNTLAANALSITGLPFAPVKGVRYQVDWKGSTASYVAMGALLSDGGTAFSIRGMTAAGGTSISTVLATNALSAAAGSGMYINGSYIAVP